VVVVVRTSRLQAGTRQWARPIPGYRAGGEDFDFVVVAVDADHVSEDGPVAPLELRWSICSLR
jgi:hypothetical protein